MGRAKHASSRAPAARQSSLEPCVPPFWARGGHAQTVWAHFLPSPRLAERGERVAIALGDGDTLVGTHYPGKTGTVVYVFHGLGGDTDAAYMQRTALVARRQGHAVYLMNHRGCGEGRGLATFPYHSGRGEDLSRAIAEGRRRYPSHRHVAIGFSLSACALLNLLTGRRGDVLPDAAIAVNGPLHLDTSALALEKGFNRIYDLQFSFLCRQAIVHRQKAGRVRETYRFPRFGTLRDFDEVYTAPAGGFRDRDDYYATCSPRDHLHAIPIPTVLLTAKDDPFVHVGDYLSAKLSPTTSLHVEETGGHMGYLSARPTPLGTRRWLDYALHHYLNELVARLG